MPPFRTYLVLSIIFFLVAFFDPKEEFGIFFDQETETPETASEEYTEADEVRDEVLRGLVEEGVLTPEQAGVRTLPEDALDPASRCKLRSASEDQNDSRDGNDSHEEQK